MPLCKSIASLHGRRELKLSRCAALSVGLLFAVAGLAQDRPQPAAKLDSPATQSASTKSLAVYGKVSNDGRTLLTDLDTEWSVSNADSLRGREGSLVTVRCYIDSNRNQIHVLSVRSGPSEAKYASRQGDSAFRR